MSPPGESPRPAFCLQRVTHRFRRADGSEAAALDGISLDVGRGEAVAIIGPSGAGKTTLLRLLNLTLRPDEGQLSVDGVDTTTLSNHELRTRRSKTATIHQQHDLVLPLRVAHNILAGGIGKWSLPRALAALVRPPASAAAIEAAREVGVLERFWERTDRLSGGEQQRVAIARALVQRVDHMLADEPVASVDVARSEAIIALLTRLAREHGSTLVVSLHDVPLALRYFPRIVGLRAGSILFDRAPTAVTETDLARLYSGEVSVVEAGGWLRRPKPT